MVTSTSIDLNGMEERSDSVTIESVTNSSTCHLLLIAIINGKLTPKLLIYNPINVDHKQKLNITLSKDGTTWESVFVYEIPLFRGKSVSQVRKFIDKHKTKSISMIVDSCTPEDFFGKFTPSTIQKNKISLHLAKRINRASGNVTYFDDCDLDNK